MAASEPGGLGYPVNLSATIKLDATRADANTYGIAMRFADPTPRVR